MKTPLWVILLALAATIFVYAAGLDGPFLFDDHIHITQNQWVKIESLAWSDLVRAWNSSFSAFPANRPLAQLTFGINHALSGLDPWAFKTTNLLIHLATGVFVFVFSRLVLRAVSGGTDDSTWQVICAATVAAAWLLHPLHVSTVLYTVQRMAQLSTLSLLVALSCYFWGRIRIAEGRSGIAWILAAAPVAMLGFLGKENAALLPLLLLVSELTVLRTVSASNQRILIRTVWILFIVFPILASLVYFALHPGYFNYDGRDFTLEERALTQTRVLWLYLQWLFIPDISAFGLFHDDIQLSNSLTDPPSTLISLIALLVALMAAILLRRKAPIFAFAVLFYLASHALESSVFPLEPIFEHRNYLASIGPLLLLGYLITIASERLKVRGLALVVGALLLIAYGFVNHIRIDNWASYNSFILSSVENHPASPRANFLAGQLVISAIANSDSGKDELAISGRKFLQRGIELDPRCINCMFGLIVLDLHLEKRPDLDLIEQLKTALRSGHVGAMKVSVSQFSHLVRWQRSGDSSLPNHELEAIFDAALENPAWTNTGRAGIEAAYREYWHHVAKDLPRALQHGNAAVRAWPSQWSYQFAVAKLLQKLDRPQEAVTVLDKAIQFADNEKKQRETAELRAVLQHASHFIE